MRLKVSHYPNNEIRVSLTGEGRRVNRTEEHPLETHETQGDSLCPQETVTTTGTPSSLDISSDFAESSKPLKPGFGGLPRRTVFGLYGKRTIQRVGGVCDRLYDHEDFVFLTGTLPGSTSAAVETMSRWSGYMVKLVKEWVSYYVDERIDFYVWEWQKRGALHLHYAVHVPDSGKRELVISRFKQQWIRLLESVSERTGVDMFERAEGGSWRGCYEEIQAYAQAVRKSVAAYLSKYCSKGHDTGIAFHYPSRWWGCSRALLKKLEEMTVSFEIVGLNLRRALQLYEELTAFNQFLTCKDYSYRHGTGLGRTSVGYHHPELELGDIQQCIMTKLSELSRGFSAVMSKNKSSQERKHLISFLQPCKHLYAPLASAPLREKLQVQTLTSFLTDEFSTSDWRELYAITCLFYSNRSCQLNLRRLKNDILREVRLSELRDREF